MSQTNSIFSLVSRGIATFVLLACISTLSLKTLAFDNSSNVFNPQLELSGVNDEISDIANNNIDDGSFQIAGVKRPSPKIKPRKTIIVKEKLYNQQIREITCKISANLKIAGVTVVSGNVDVTTTTNGVAVAVYKSVEVYEIIIATVNEICGNIKTSVPLENIYAKDEQENIAIFDTELDPNLSLQPLAYDVLDENADPNLLSFSLFDVTTDDIEM